MCSQTEAVLKHCDLPFVSGYRGTNSDYREREATPAAVARATSLPVYSCLRSTD